MNIGSRSIRMRLKKTVRIPDFQILPNRTVKTPTHSLSSAGSPGPLTECVPVRNSRLPGWEQAVTHRNAETPRPPHSVTAPIPGEILSRDFLKNFPEGSFSGLVAGFFAAHHRLGAV